MEEDGSYSYRSRNKEGREREKEREKKKEREREREREREGERDKVSGSETERLKEVQKLRESLYRLQSHIHFMYMYICVQTVHYILHIHTFMRWSTLASSCVLTESLQ